MELTEADAGLERAVAVGEDVVVLLEENATTGHGWRFVLPGGLELVGDDFRTGAGAGAAGTHRLRAEFAVRGSRVNLPARWSSCSAPAGSVPVMVRALGLPYDPIERAGESWEKRFGPAAAMRAATSVFRVQQLLLARFDEVLRPYELTFARYEVLVLLTFSRTGELPLKVIGSRLMVHPTSVTNAIDRLVAAGYVDRRPNPADGRGVLAAITAAGRSVVDEATAALTGLEFGLGELPDAELDTLFEILKRVRLGAGDVAGAQPQPAVDGG